VSPEEVEQWSNPDFLDRLEFMHVQIEIDQQMIEDAERDRK